MKTRVSVTMPAYNAERFITSSIESVLRQGYPNFELIILDDGSKDKTSSIIDRYSKNQRVRIYRQKNRGLGAARQRLDELAKGSYISPHDADDIMLPGKLGIQAECLDKNPDVGVVYGKAKLIDENNRILNYDTLLKISGSYFGTDINKTWDLLFGVVPFGSCMYRKALLAKAGGYNGKLKIATDIDIFLKLAEVTKFHFFNRTFYLYRRHRKNISTNKKLMYHEIIAAKKEAILRRYGKGKDLSFLW